MSAASARKIPRLCANQDRRKRALEVRLDHAVRVYIVAVQEDRRQEFAPSGLGFEFSLDQILNRATAVKFELFAKYDRQEEIDSRTRLAARLRT